MSSFRKFKRRESASEVGYRLNNEQNCRAVADLIKSKLHPGLGFVLVTCTYGGAGDDFQNASYVSTLKREDAARLLTEMLDKWSPDGLVVEPSVETATFVREHVFALRDEPLEKVAAHLVETAQYLAALVREDDPEDPRLVSQAGLATIQAMAVFDRLMLKERQSKGPEA